MYADAQSRTVGIVFIAILENGVEVRQAFDKACAQLGLGTNSDDNGRREQLAKVILGLAQDGERDAIALQYEAVRMMQSGV
jgi:hypothetical protein